MHRERETMIVDREGAILELRRLAGTLWDVHNRRVALPGDTKNVYETLSGWLALAGNHMTPGEMIDVILEVTNDLEFTLETVRTLIPGVILDVALDVH